MVWRTRRSKSLDEKLTMLRPQRREQVEARAAVWIETELLLIGEFTANGGSGKKRAVEIGAGQGGQR